MEPDSTRGRRSTVARGAAALIVLSCATWVFFAAHRRDVARPGSVAKRDDLHAVDPAAAESAPATPERAREAMSRDPVGGDEEARSDPDEEDGRIHRVDGVVILIDAKGIEHLDADGEMTVIRNGRGDAPHEKVAVAKGRFHVDIPGVSYGVILTLTLDGHIAFTSDTDLETRTLAPDGKVFFRDDPVLDPQVPRGVVVHARSARPTLLHVVDERSGAELTGVTVRDVGWGEDTVLVEGAPSPIELEAPPETFADALGPSLKIEVRGYLPQDCSVSYRWGGEIFVPTSRAAYLSVNVEGAPPRSLLGVFTPGDPPSGFVPTQGSEWLGNVQCGSLIESPTPLDREPLPAGRYLVAVVTGHLEYSWVPVARQEIELHVGETTTVALVCREVHHAEPVPIGGTVEVPGDWGDRSFRIVIDLEGRPELAAANHRDIASDAMSCAEGDPRVFHWSDPGVEPGTYSFEVAELGVHGRWVVGPRGREDLRIVAGGSAELALHVLEDSTGAPIGESRVEWSGESGDLFVLSQSSPHGEFVGRVPQGRGALHPPSETRVVESDPIEIHAGRNELTLHLHRLPGVVLPLSCEGRRVPWSDVLSCGIDPIDHDGEWMEESWSDDESKCVLVSKPGRYRVQLPEFFGFEPVPPFVVDVPDGRLLVRRIELKHKL